MPHRTVSSVVEQLSAAKSTFDVQVLRCKSCKSLVKPNITFFKGTQCSSCCVAAHGVSAHCGMRQAHAMICPDNLFAGTHAYAQLTVHVFVPAERMPMRFEHKRGSDLRKAQLLIIMGTSLQVMPFAGLVNDVKESCPRLLINRQVVGTTTAERLREGYTNGLWFGTRPCICKQLRLSALHRTCSHHSTHSSYDTTCTVKAFSCRA